MILQYFLYMDFFPGRYVLHIVNDPFFDIHHARDTNSYSCNTLIKYFFNGFYDFVQDLFFFSPSGYIGRDRLHNAFVLNFADVYSRPTEIYTDYAFTGHGFLLPKFERDLFYIDIPWLIDSAKFIFFIQFIEQYLSAELFFCHEKSHWLSEALTIILYSRYNQGLDTKTSFQAAGRTNLPTIRL